MAGYIGTKAVNLSTTGADIAGDADVSGALDVGGAITGVNATLSGGVFLGGTGSANKLDDYETGTFTPIVSWQSGSPSYSSQGLYTKVGNIVTIRASISVTASGGSGVVSIQNIPFTAYSMTQTGCGAERGNTGKSIGVWLDSSSTRLNMRYYDYSNVGTTSGDVMVVSATYQVA